MSNQHHLRPQRAASLDAERVGRLRHHHLGMHAAGLRRPQAAASAKLPPEKPTMPLTRRGAQPVDPEQRAARLEGPGMLEQLELHVELGIGDVGGDPAAAKRQDRRADHPPVQLVAGRGNPGIKACQTGHHAPTLARRCGAVNEIQRASAQVPGDAETLMRGARIRRDSGPCRDPVAVAVAAVAQERAAL